MKKLIFCFSLLSLAAVYAGMNVATQSKTTTVTTSPTLIMPATNGIYSTSFFVQNTSAVPVYVTADTNGAWYCIPAGGTFSMDASDLRDWYGKVSTNSASINAIREIGVK